MLTAWRQNTYDLDPISFLYNIQDIITEDRIGLIAKISFSQLHRDGPEAIMRELEETLEWGSRYVQEMFEQVWKYDHSDSAQVPMYT